MSLECAAKGSEFFATIPERSPISITMIITPDSSVRRQPDLTTAVVDLCEAILAQDGVRTAQAEVESFFDNDEAATKYTTLAQLGGALHRKQHAGEEITDAEEREYQRLHDVAMGDNNVRRFLEAKSALENVHSMVVAYVGKTLELGRVPEQSDFAQSGGGCCGGGGGSSCGC